MKPQAITLYIRALAESLTNLGATREELLDRAAQRYKSLPEPLGRVAFDLLERERVLVREEGEEARYSLGSKHSTYISQRGAGLSFIADSVSVPLTIDPADALLAVDSAGDDSTFFSACSQALEVKNRLSQSAQFLRERAREPFHLDPDMSSEDGAFMGLSLSMDRQEKELAIDLAKAIEGGIYARLASPNRTRLLLPVELDIGAGSQTRGLLVQAVGLAWEKVLEFVAEHPEALARLPWRHLEELIAGAYRERGWAVELTPRSADGGRDIIASRTDVGSLRIFDEVKCYRPGHVVSAKEVRALVGILRGNVSKGVLSTTSTFAKGVWGEFADLMPNRLELREGPELHQWLLESRSLDERHP